MPSNFKEYQRQHNGITWKDYVDLRFAEADKALRIATSEMNRRLEGMNELRQQLDRQGGTFVTRVHLDGYTERVSERLSIIEKSIAASEARMKAYAAIISIIASTTIAFIFFLAKSLLIK